MNAKSKMYFMQLIAIKRLNNPDQTVGFIEHFENWMKQWTIANNFKPMVTDDPQFALETWWNDYANVARRILGSSIPKHLNLAEQIEFKYAQSEVTLNRGFYLHDRVLNVVCDEIEKEKEEVSITVIPAHGAIYRSATEAEEAWDEDKCFIVIEPGNVNIGQIFSRSTLPTLIGNKVFNRIIIGTSGGKHLTTINV